MRFLCRNLAAILLAALMVSPVFVTGCAVRARVYDPYYHDYHDWNGEAVYYNQWEHDTHRNHEDFRKRKSDEQKEYWDWRHKQERH